MARTLQALERDWRTTALSPQGLAAFERWRDREPVLGSFASADEVVDDAQRRGDPAGSNRLLAALLRLGADETLACRALLQALVPALAHLALRYPMAGEDVDERLQEAVALTMERVHAFSGTDQEWVATVILGWVRDRLRRSRHGARLPELPLDAARNLHAPNDRPTGERLAGHLVEAVRQGVLAREDAAVVYATRVAGLTPAEVAVAIGVDAGLVRTRRFRAERRLTGLSAATC